MKKILLALLFISNISFAQQTALSLEEAVQMAKDKSIAAKQASTQKETDFWRFKSFQADFKPQLSLSGALPSFTRSFIQVLQPDGAVAFQSVSNNNSTLTLALSQSIAKTGGTIYVQKQLQRFDDFERNSTLYNGVPVAFGLSQPLFRYNQMKWDKQIEPLKYSESQQVFLESLEKVSLNVSDYYFDLLIAQVNLQIAEKNRSNNDTLYKIASKRLELGKISENDILQLRLSVLNAQKDLASAKQQAEVAMLQLKAYIGYREANKFDLAIPFQLKNVEIDAQKAIQAALGSRSDAIAFRRRILEAERDLNKAKAENGLNANLNVAFGLSNRGTKPLDIYKNAQDREFVEIQFTLPIMDWGRSKARTETAKANLQLTQQSVEQDKLTFEQQIYTQVTLFEMLQKQVKLTAETDEIATKRYQIAQDRYILADLSITDLGIALQEKDRAKRDYIVALRDYWRAYYTLRYYTLYDFEQNTSLNPSK